MAVRVAAAGFVLTGGESRRMGRDKALLELGGQPLVLRMAAKFRGVTSEVYLVGAPERYARLGLPVLADPIAGRGPAAGITAALRATEREWNLIVACDLPYLETRFLEFLVEVAAAEGDAEAVVPQLGGRWEPLCAAYHRRALPAFERVLAGVNYRIARALEALRVRAVTEKDLAKFAFSPRMFKNMNWSEEYEEAKRDLGG
jgi:molybdopterin-guanine dinucleotide biosynthesis protein A